MPYANNNGVRIHYEVEGSGPPLVLHHGFNFNLESWRWLGLAEPLKHDYRLVLMDSRGHGASDKPHDPNAYRLPLRVADVLAVLDDLGVKKTHYLGSSMGGWVGWGIAKYAPQRFMSLIISDYSPFGRLPEGSNPRQDLLAGREAYVASAERRFGSRMTPAMRAMFQTNDLEALLAATAAMQDDLDIADQLPEIALPCLLCGGDQDPLFAGIEKCARLMPRATVLSLPGLGHGGPFLAPDLTIPHIRRFLASVEKGCATAPTAAA